MRSVNSSDLSGRPRGVREHRAGKGELGERALKKIPARRHLAGGGANIASNGLKLGLSTNDLATERDSSRSLGTP